MKFLRSIWLQRFIIILCASAAGILADRLTWYPYWGAVAALGVTLAGFIKLNHPFLLSRALKLDTETAALLRTLLLTLIFFLLCIATAYTIVASINY